jgi:hypothetical protein
MTQREITKPTLLLNEKGGLLQPGYAKEMLYLYNRQRAAGRPFGLKEWDFYQLAIGEWVLQMTVGHVSYMTNFSANLISLTTGERFCFNHMRPLPMRSMDIPLHPNRPNRLCAKGKGFSISFDTEEKYRTLSLKAENGNCPVDIEMTLPHRAGDEVMVIATPFEKPEQFYLNCKEHFYGVKGYARFGNLVVEAYGEETALLDWGRGVWPFHQEWFWGCGAGQTGGGRFGFNIGWGFGNLEYATENMFFWNGKAYKLGMIIAERDENDYMAPWHFTSDDGSFDLTLSPVFDNDTSTKFAFVNNRCHQVFGRYNGTAVLPDGKTIRVENLLAFCEHAVNNW